MEIRFLGTGTSTGVPEIGCKCKVCQSTDARDRRLRSSVLVTHGSTRILIDCGPDFRQQMLNLEFRKIDGVLITHEHYDHVGGLDDLRPFGRFGDIPVYTETYVGSSIQMRMPYIFAEHRYPGIPKIDLQNIHPQPFYIQDIEITPIRIMHYKLRIFGYRIGKFAYITDMSSIAEEEFIKLQGLDVLVVNALRIQEHLSHQNLKQALAFASRVKAGNTYFIHMSHDIGLHSEIEKLLPAHHFFAYDGLVIQSE